LICWNLKEKDNIYIFQYQFNIIQYDWFVKT